MAAEDKVGKGAGVMAFMVMSLLLTLVGAGAGFTVGTLIRSLPQEQAEVPPGREPPAGDPHAAAPARPATGSPREEPGGGEEVGLKVQAFPPVLTTLAAPPGRWVRLEGVALLRGETHEPPEYLAERAAEQVLTYLRTVRLDQIEGPSGVLGLREDLDEMVKVLSDGQVQGILLHGLVVE